MMCWRMLNCSELNAGVCGICVCLFTTNARTFIMCSLYERKLAPAILVIRFIGRDIIMISL